MEQEKIKKTISSIRGGMTKDAKEFDQQVSTIKEDREREEFAQQYILRRQYDQEQINDLQQKLDSNQFTGLSYHIPDPTTY